MGNHDQVRRSQSNCIVTVPSIIFTASHLCNNTLLPSRSMPAFSSTSVLARTVGADVPVVSVKTQPPSLWLPEAPPRAISIFVPCDLLMRLERLIFPSFLLWKR